MPRIFTRHQPVPGGGPPELILVATTAQLDPLLSAWSAYFDIEGNYLYLPMPNATTGSGYFKCLSIANPAAPAEVGSILDTSLGTGAGNVTVENHIAYCCNGNLSGVTFDVSDPTNPTGVTHTFPVPSYAAVAFAQGGHHYVALTNVTSGNFEVYLVDTPAAPTLQGSIAGQYGDFIVYRGGYVYLTDEGHAVGLLTIDVSDPTHPAIVDTYATYRYGPLALSGIRLYWTSGNIIETIDLTDPANPVHADYNSAQNYAPVIAATGTYFFSASYDSAPPDAHIEAWDATPIDWATWLDDYPGVDTWASAWSKATTGNYIYVTAWDMTHGWALKLEVYQLAAGSGGTPVFY